MATADATIAQRRPGATGRKVRRIGARAALYAVAWFFAIGTLVPILYAILGGFRDTGQLSTNPVALPDPWVFTNYSEILAVLDLLAPGLEQRPHRAGVDGAHRAGGGARGVHLRPLRLPRARGALHDLHARAALPGRHRDPSDLHHGAQPRAARQPARRRPPPGGLRPADDDHHPAPVLPQHPVRPAGRRGHRRVRAVALLRADPAAALASRPRHGLGAGHRRQLERLPAPAASSSRTPAAGRCRWA